MTFKILNQMEDWVDWASIDTWIIKNKKKEDGSEEKMSDKEKMKEALEKARDRKKKKEDK